MFKGGSIKPIIIAFLAINAVLIAYSFPYLVFAYENRNLNGYGIHYEAEPVRVESDTITFNEKLENMTMVMENYTYVLVSDESINSGDFTVNLDRTKAFNCAVDGFIDIFMDAEYLKPLGLNKRGVKTELSSKYEHYANMYLIIRPDTEDMYLAWDIIIYFDNGNIEVLVDDETGKLMSSSVYIYDDEAFEDMFKKNYFDEKLGTRLANYYDMKYIDSEYSRMVKVSNDYSDNNYVARTVKLMADDPDDDVELSYIIKSGDGSGFVVYFNYFNYSTVDVEVDESVEEDTVIEYNTVIGDDAMKDQQNSQDFLPDFSNGNPATEEQGGADDVASSTDAQPEQSSEAATEEQKPTETKTDESKSGDSKGTGGANSN